MDLLSIGSPHGNLGNKAKFKHHYVITTFGHSVNCLVKVPQSHFNKGPGLCPSQYLEGDKISFEI